MIHIYQGFCPDDLQPDSRDPNCPACQVEAERDALRAENARLTAELAAARELAYRLVCAMDADYQLEIDGWQLNHDTGTIEPLNK